MNQAFYGYNKNGEPIFGPEYTKSTSTNTSPIISGLGIGGRFKDLFSNLWNKKSGIAKIGPIANTVGGVYQGGKALSNLISLESTGDDLSKLRSDIIASAYNNPLSNDYLSADQKKLLRQLKTGSYGSQTASNALGAGFGGAVKALPKATLNALLGLVSGGGIGAAIQGIGTLTNAGLEGANESKQNRTSELQALYEALANAEQDYNTMKRPQNLRTAGLSQRAYAGLY